jgi:hypothetical protein
MVYIPRIDSILKSPFPLEEDRSMYEKESKQFPFDEPDTEQPLPPYGDFLLLSFMYIN